MVLRLKELKSDDIHNPDPKFSMNTSVASGRVYLSADHGEDFELPEGEMEPIFIKTSQPHSRSKPNFMTKLPAEHIAYFLTEMLQRKDYEHE